MNPSLRARPALTHLLGVLAVALLVACLAGTAFWLEKQRYQERALLATRNMVQLLERNIADEFEKIDLALRAGALVHRDLLAAGPIDEARLKAYLKNLGALVPQADSVRILDHDGYVRFGQGADPAKPPYLGDRSYFQRARDEPRAGLVISEPVFGRIVAKWLLVFARRLEGPDGSFRGVIVATVATDHFQPLLSSMALGQQGAATIRGADMALVHRVPTTKNAVGSREVSAQLREAIAAKPGGGDYVAATALDGIERINAYRRVGDYPFYVIVGLATQDFAGGWRENALLLAGLAALTVFIAAAAALRNLRAQRRLEDELDERRRLNDQLQQSLDERRRLNDELLVRAREAEAASVAKSAFLANMSHELRTPLNQIQGAAAIVARDPTTPKQAERLRTIGDACRRLTELVTTILNLTRIEAGNLDLARQPLAIADVVDPAVDAVRAEAAAKRLALVVEALPEVDGLLGDQAHLKLALANYLSNALRFTAAGTITVRAKLLQQDDAAATLRFEVEDTGEGIRAEDLPRLFSIFEQGDNSPTRRHGGLGAGLVTTRKIAEAMGGDAGCESRYGEGSLFWFKVRLARQAH